MGAGYLDHGAPGAAVHIDDIHPNQVAGLVSLAGNLLAEPEHSVMLLPALTDADEHIPGGVHPQHGAGEQLLGLGGITIVGRSPLCLPDALNHHLLGGLGGNPAELLNVDGDNHGVSQLHVGIDLPGSVDLDFQSQILRHLHHGLDLVHGQALLAQIHHHVLTGHIPVVLPVLPVGVGEGLLQPLHHIVYGNPLLLFQLIQAGENLSTNLYLGLFHFFLGSCVSCHDGFSSYQNSTRSRTRATSDFSKVMVSLPASTVTLPSS